MQGARLMVLASANDEGELFIVITHRYQSLICKE